MRRGALWSVGDFFPNNVRFAPGALRVYLTLFLTAWLLGAGCGGRGAQQTNPALSSGRGSASVERTSAGGSDAMTFTDVTHAAGISFTHTNGGFGKKYYPETFGSGGAFFDFNGDGWLDILLLNGRSLKVEMWKGSKVETSQPSNLSTFQRSTHALYRSNRDGTFADVTQGSGLDVALYAMGCCVGDYDNDGDEDVYVTCALEPSRLFRNEGNGKFRDVTAEAGVNNAVKGAGRGADAPAYHWGTSCAWLDYNKDGWLDLFVGNYVRYTLAEDKWCSLVPGRKSYCPPHVYEGDTCVLYRNNGDGTFTDVTRSAGVEKEGAKALGVAILDYNKDGWLDVAVANDETPNFLYRNQGDGTFVEVAMETGFAFWEGGAPKAGMGIDAADYRNNGGVGILISNFSNEGLSLYDLARPSHFSEIAFRVGLGEPSLLFLGFGLFFFDYDNDGWKDCYIANGHINDDIQEFQSNVTYGERNLLFHNRRDGTFTEVGLRCGKPLAYERVSRGAAYGDYDNDGDLDILVTNNNGPAELLRNEGGNKSSWLQIELRGRKGREGEGRGQEDKETRRQGDKEINHPFTPSPLHPVTPSPAVGGSNRSAIGAHVTVQAGGVTQRDWVRSGSSYLSQSMLRLHFGLGTARQADVVEVRWSSGRVDRLRNVKSNQILVVEEGTEERKPTQK